MGSEYVAVMSFLPLIVHLAACQLDPAGSAASAYVDELEPLLHENSLLAESVLFQAAGIYNESIRSEEVATAWTTKIVPLSEHLAHQASFVEPSGNWAASHAELVSIWSERAQAYRTISEGLRAADVEQWNQGSALAEQARTRETDWFAGLNVKLNALGMQIDAYP